MSNIKCWICDSEKNFSKEHKFKASDIKRFHGKTFKEPVIIIIGDQTSYIQGPNSSLVKHKQPICQNCNNKLTAEHDKAYDIFVTSIINNHILSMETGYIDVSKIFGENWKTQMRNLYKYYAKQIGSRIVDSEGTEHSKTIKNFILHDEDIQSIKLSFYLKKGMAALDMHMIETKGRPLKYLNNGSTITYEYNNQIYFHGWSSNSWLTVHWLYTEEGFKDDSLKSEDPIIRTHVQEINLEGRTTDISPFDWFENYGVTNLDEREEFIINMINNTL